MGIVTKSLSKAVSMKNGKRQLILKNVSLDIATGELVAIQGKSGAGKTTLLQILGCLDSNATGEYRLDDVSILPLSVSEKAKLRNHKFGFVMQDYALINDESVIDNIMLPALFAKQKWRDASKRARELVHYIKMDELADKKVSFLSGGEKQRVAILRAMMNDPAYILADEPTGAIDTQNAQDIMEIFRILNKEHGKTILIVTHDDAIASRCDRIIRISDGKIV